MKKQSRFLALSLVLIMTVAMLCSCSSPAVSGSSQAPSNSAAGGTAGALSGTVAYWSMWNENEPAAQALQYAIELFEKDYPDCKVEVNWMGRSMKETTGAAIQAGEAIDVFDYVNYSQDPTLFADLTDMMSQPAYGQDGKTVEESIAPIQLEANRQAQIAAGMDPEKYFGVPMNGYCGCIFYNKALFKQAGITSVPATWDELMQTAQTLKDAGITPFTTDDAYAATIGYMYLKRLVGKEGVKALSQGSSDAMWEDPAILKTLTDMEQITPYFSQAAINNKYPAGQQEFAIGDTAMYIYNASWMPSEVADTVEDDFAWGAFTFPVVEGGVETATDICFGGNQTFISAKSTNAAAAKEFLRYCISKDVQDKFAVGGLMPSTIGSEWPREIADLQPAVEAGKTACGLWADLSGDFVDSTWYPEVINVIKGLETAEKAYASIQSKR